MPQAPTTTMLTIRLWVEALDERRCEWRGQVTNVATREIRYFRRWEELAELVPAMVDELRPGPHPE